MLPPFFPPHECSGRKKASPEREVSPYPNLISHHGYGVNLFREYQRTFKKSIDPSIYTLFPAVYRIIFQIHGSKIKPDPLADLGQVSEICKSHRVLFFCVLQTLVLLFLFVCHTVPSCLRCAWDNHSGCALLLFSHIWHCLCICFCSDSIHIYPY